MNTLTIILIVALSLVVVYFILSALVPTLVDFIIKILVKILTYTWLALVWLLMLIPKLIKLIFKRD